MIKVLIIDNSNVVREFLAYILASDPTIQIAGFANDGADAVAAVREMRPDVITMDIHMQNIDGFEATRAIMENVPTPIVIVSASNSVKEIATTFKALDAGALTVVQRPFGIGHIEHETTARELIQMVKLMSEIKVVKRHVNLQKERVLATPLFVPTQKISKEIQLIAIGASTGGPPVLNKIFSLLPLDLPVPLLIVQHITHGYTKGFVEWLSDVSHFPVHIAVHNQKPSAGNGYVAPDGFYMGITRGSRIILSENISKNGLLSSVDFLFRSVSQELGSQVLGVLLTGMGRDGVEGLKMLKDRGAVTIAQDKDSSVVHGMPGEAIKIDAASYILSPEAIATMLTNLAMKTNMKISGEKYE